MTNKIIFLDIDGPMIPGRCAFIKGQTKIMKVFDPVAVGMLNHICQDKGWKIVIHSSWIKIIGGQETYDHCIEQGLKPQYFHKDAWCDETLNWRYSRVARWLQDHPDVKRYVILDDDKYEADLNEIEHPEDMEKHLIKVDYMSGLLLSHMDRLKQGGHPNKQT